ncbi:MAG: efflux RND transporter periplasmic adaptor subunit [Chloroflexota bacterium]
MKFWQTVFLILPGLILVAAAACNPLGGQPSVTTQPVKVTRGDLDVTVSGSGSVEVADEAKLSFGAAGKIARITVEQGDKVQAGDLLASLDTDALELALTQARLALAQANLARAQAISARDQAQYDLNYLKNITRATSDRIKVQESQLAAAEVQIKTTEAQIESSEQGVAHAQKQLDEAVITAPLSGVVAEVFPDEGDTVAATTTVIHLVDPATMEVKVEVDEIDVPKVGPGGRAVVTLDALPDREFEGEVARIAVLPTLEGGVVSYQATISFDVAESDGVRIGMSATADIVVQSQTGVLLLPNRAIGTDSQGKPVVKVPVSGANGASADRSIVTGITNGIETEVVSGLEEGDTVLIERQVESASPSLFGG